MFSSTDDGKWWIQKKEKDQRIVEEQESGQEFIFKNIPNFFNYILFIFFSICQFGGIVGWNSEQIGGNDASINFKENQKISNKHFMVNYPFWVVMGNIFHIVYIIIIHIWWQQERWNRKSTLYLCDFDLSGPPTSIVVVMLLKL